MRADHQRNRAILQAAQQLRPRAAFHPTGQQGDRCRRQPRQRAMMLLRQHLGRRHHRCLLAGLNRAQHGQQRHHRLARADIALQEAQHPPARRQVGIDLRQRLLLRPGKRPTEPSQRFRPQGAVAAKALSRPGAQPAAHHRQCHLVGEEFIIGEPCAAGVAGYFGRCLHRAQRRGEVGPLLTSQQRGVVPFRQGGKTRQSAGDRLRHLPFVQPFGQTPHRVDPAESVPTTGGFHVIGRAEPRAAVELGHLAGHQAGCADAQHARRRALEIGQLDAAGGVARHDAMGLPGVGRLVAPHHLDREGGDLAWPRLCDGRACATIQVRLGQVEQDVDHPLAAGRLGEQRRHRRADALQRGQRREQRRERIMIHGLTWGCRAAI